MFCAVITSYTKTYVIHVENIHYFRLVQIMLADGYIQPLSTSLYEIFVQVVTGHA
jgi:hypothetical protein